MKNLPPKDRFSKNKSLKKISNHLLSLFKSRNFYPGASFEMHDFFTTYDGYFSDDLLTFRNWDIVFEKLGMLDAKIFINPLKEYVNIRAYFISQADYKKQEYIYYEKYRNKYAPLDYTEREYIQNQKDATWDGKESVAL